MRVAFLLAFAAFVRSLSAQGLEARTEHFRVVTLGTAQMATQVAMAAERARAQFAALGFAGRPSQTEIVILRDIEEIERLAALGAPGFFQQGTDANFIAVAWSGGGDPLQALAHEVAHEALLPWTAKHPAWLREGLAEMLGHLEPASGGLKLVAPLASQKDGMSSYSEGWARAHWLIVGKPGSLTDRIAALEEPQWSQRPSAGMLLEEILPASTPEIKTLPPVRLIESWEYEHRVAEMLRAMNRNDAARQALLALQSKVPDRPEPYESLGALEMDALHHDRAEQWLAKAVLLGSTNASTHYRYSLLLMRPEGSPELALRHARRAVELNPSRALYWLAKAQAETQAKQWDAARASLASMRSRTSDPVLLEQVRIELAEVGRWQEQGRRGPPVPAPPEIRPLPRTGPPLPEDEKAATVAAERSRRSNITSWPPPGTVLLWGKVRSVECSAEGKIVTVVNPMFLVRVRERAGSPARLYSAPRNMRQIPCTLSNVEVNVVYRPLADFGSLNGDLVALVF